MSAQESSLQPDFRERAKANDVPVARLIGFEAKDVAGGRATVILAAGPQHANPMGTLHGGILCDIADAATAIQFGCTDTTSAGKYTKSNIIMSADGKQGLELNRLLFRPSARAVVFEDQS
jgi:acyl-coenzyme A thioesterase PaaI-like protein